MPENVTAAHEQHASSSYVEHYPDHAPREDDPHYHLFHAYHRRFGPTAKCWVGVRIGAEHCAPGPLELHHSHIEESVQNETLLAAVRKDWPDIDDEEAFLEFVQSDRNFRWLCSWHHRSAAAGAHHVSHSDWEAGAYSPAFLTQYDDAHPAVPAQGGPAE